MARRLRPFLNPLFKQCDNCYFKDMAQTLEQRVDELEKKVSELTPTVVGSTARDWKATFGLSKDDEGFDEMNRLGRDYRRAQKGEGVGAGP
jgi:hypothetical protein